MSASPALPNILAALPANPGKAPVPPANSEQMSDKQPPFAAVLQQKISHNENKPATNTPAPVDAKTAAPANNAETATAAPVSPATELSTGQPDWLSLLPAAITQNTATTTPQLDKGAQDAPTSDIISLVESAGSAQTAAGQLQAAQALNSTQLQVSDGLKANQPTSRNKLDTSLPAWAAAAETNTTTSAATQAGTEDAANLAAEALGNTPHHAHHTDLAAGQDSAASFANAMSNQIVNEKPAVQIQPQATLATPVGTDAWSNELGERLVWMSNRQESRAELTLNPPQMGKIEVSLNINGDQASVSFVSANPQVRDALESAMNRLREALAANGINLGQSNVGAESSGNFAQQQQSPRQNKGSDGGTSFGSIEAGTVANPWQSRSNAMLDVFA